MAKGNIEHNPKFSNNAISDIVDELALAKGIFKDLVIALENRDKKVAEKIIEKRDKMNRFEKLCTKAHLQRLDNKKCSPEFTETFTNVIHCITRICYASSNIAEEVLSGELEFKELTK